MSSSAHALGRLVPRLEDAPLLRGHGRFWKWRLLPNATSSAYSRAAAFSADADGDDLAIKQRQTAL